MRRYLERLAAICTKHDILLIFDEVITGFGRLGAPFAASCLRIQPDLITTAKGLTNGAVPMGAVFAQSKIHDAFMSGPEAAIEFNHGYTYSGHPLAAAACIATLDTFQEEGLMTRARELDAYWEDAVHSLGGLPHVIDVRNMGLIGAVEFEPIAGEPGKRTYNRFMEALRLGALVRATGDTIALAPPLIIDRREIDELIDIVARALRTTHD